MLQGLVYITPPEQIEEGGNFAFFDLEGTLTKETLDEIAERFGVAKEVKEVTAKTMGSIDALAAFQDKVEKRLDILIDAASNYGVSLTEDYLIRYAKETRLNYGAGKLIRELKRQGVYIIILSGGLDPVVREYAKRLGADAYVCNKPHYDDSRNLIGTIDCYVNGNKLDWIKVIKIEHKAAKASMMGDGSNDAEALGSNEIFGVATNNAQKVAKEKADIKISGKNLYSAFTHLMGYFRG